MTLVDRITIEAVSWQTHSDALSEIRRIVFIEEQAVPPSEEWDPQDRDSTTHQFLVTLDSKPIGTARLLNNGQIGRLCVLKSHRAAGIGAALFQYVLQYGLRQGHENFFLNAQLEAIGLYERFGFNCIGDIFWEAGIRHKRMELKVQSIDQLAQIYCDQVIRFEGTDEFQFHLHQMTRFGKRDLRMLTRELNPALFNHQGFQAQLSHLARYSRYSDVRILIQDTRPLIGTRHGVIDLAHRLSSAIQIRKTTLAPKTEDQAYVIIDDECLLFLNSEENVMGFANYRAKAESKHILEEFNYLWESHSKNEENFRQLHM